MTAAGIAFIAGGIATLICLRSVLFGRGKQPEGRGKREGSPKQLEGRPKPDGRPRPLEGPPKQLELGSARPRQSPKLRSDGLDKLRLEGRTRQRSEGYDKLRLEAPPREDLAPALTETAELGLPTARRASRAEFETPRQYRRHDLLESLEPQAAPSEPEVILGEEESRPIPVRRVDRNDRTYGDRVDGWIRPEYHDDPAEPPSGEYWTPLPMEGLDLPDADPEPSARGYGWPTPVERLPAVPDYEPATGFDLTPVESEPTELVPTWPPMPDEERRVRLPRSWASRDTKPADNRFLDNDARRPDTDQRFQPPSAEPTPRRRPRPRPRPAATNQDNFYVSRHAADPPL
jgi:hypothetical protein